MFQRIKENTKKATDIVLSGISWILKHKKTIAVFSLLLVSGSIHQASSRPRKRLAELDCGFYEIKDEPEKDCYYFDNSYFCSTTENALASTQATIISKEEAVNLSSFCEQEEKHYLETDCGTFQWFHGELLKNSNPFDTFCFSHETLQGTFCSGKQGNLKKTGKYITKDVRNTTMSQVICKDIEPVTKIIRYKKGLVERISNQITNEKVLISYIFNMAKVLDEDPELHILVNRTLKAGVTIAVSSSEEPETFWAYEKKDKIIYLHPNLLKMMLKSDYDLKDLFRIILRNAFNTANDQFAIDNLSYEKILETLIAIQPHLIMTPIPDFFISYVIDLVHKRLLLGNHIRYTGVTEYYPQIASHLVDAVTCIQRTRKVNKTALDAFEPLIISYMKVHKQLSGQLYIHVNKNENMRKWSKNVLLPNVGFVPIGIQEQRIYQVHVISEIDGFELGVTTADPALVYDLSRKKSNTKSEFVSDKKLKAIRKDLREKILSQDVIFWDKELTYSQRYSLSTLYTLKFEILSMLVAEKNCQPIKTQCASERPPYGCLQKFLECEFNTKESSYISSSILIHSLLEGRAHARNLTQEIFTDLCEISKKQQSKTNDTPSVNGFFQFITSIFTGSMLFGFTVTFSSQLINRLNLSRPYKSALKELFVLAFICTLEPKIYVAVCKKFGIDLLDFVLNLSSQDLRSLPMKIALLSASATKNSTSSFPAFMISSVGTSIGFFCAKKLIPTVEPQQVQELRP